MLENSLYNLMLQLTEENKSLYRIKNEYVKDCEGREAETAFWQKMAKDKEEHVAELMTLINAHMG